MVSVRSHPDPVLSFDELVAIIDEMKNVPADFDDMTGVLECRICLRPIRVHKVGEWCARSASFI